MRRLGSLLSVLIIIASAAAVINVASAGDADTVHYPDLQTLKLSDVKFQRIRSTGQKFIRLSNTAANLGQGRFELRPVHDAATGTTVAYQRLYSHDAGGDWYLTGEEAIGTFEFHSLHGHWHFDDFALYELRNIAADGQIGEQVLASSGKVTFCIIDTGLIDGGLEHAAGATYTSCGQNAVQGLSVGWGDTYTWNLAGQSIDVTNVPQGDYWLVSTVDPDDIVLEGGGAAESNNTAAVKVRLRPNGVRAIQ